MRNKLLKKKIFLIIFCFITFASHAQYAYSHYIAPSPWQYWSNANEIVLTTESPTPVTVTLKKSDGTLLSTRTVTSAVPDVSRFTGNPWQVTSNRVYTIENDRGLIVEATGGKVSVNLRNVASDQASAGGGDTDGSTIKGNASLVSFGNEGRGTSFRLGYYRTNFAGIRGFNGAANRPVYSMMAIDDNTQVKLNGIDLVLLNKGQSYLIQPTGTGDLLESNKPMVGNTGAYTDAPGGCGDGAVDQMAPISILGQRYIVVSGNGNSGSTTNLPEQTTFIATEPGTNVTVTNYSAAGVLISTTVYPLATGGNFQTIFHGDPTTNFPYSSSVIESDKPIAVYSGTAFGCEVDIATALPIGGCSGSKKTSTTKFTKYDNSNLPYFGFILIESPTTPIFLNGVDMTTIGAVPARFQIGTTGHYLQSFTNTQIGNPLNLIITSTARLNVGMVQQGGGFSMAGYFSSFNETPDMPTVTKDSNGCAIGVITADAALVPYQWYLDGVLLPGETNQSIVPTRSGNYSITGVRDCGLTAQSAAVYVSICGDRGVTKTVADGPLSNQVIFTVTATNNGITPDNNVKVNDQLPTGYTYVSSTVSVGNYTSSTGVWNVGDLIAGGSATLTITATVNASGATANTATITGANIDTNAINDTATATPVGKISLVKTSDIGAYNRFGDLIRYNLLITNEGRVPLFNIGVVDTNADAGSITPASIGSLAPGASATCTASHTITLADLVVGSVVNSASVTGEDGSSNPVTDISGTDVTNNIPTVTKIVINAEDDSPVTPVNGHIGDANVLNVLDNDLLDGTAVVPSEVAITITTPATNPGVKLDPLTGIVSVDPQTPVGTYTIVYQLCEVLDPTNCDPAMVTIVVDPPVLVATDDSPTTPVNGHTGNTNVVNVLDNDTLDGSPVIPSEVVITITTPPTNPGVKLDPLTGIVSVDPQTPAGTYTIVYQLCEILNPTNCDPATVTIVVDPPVIVATDDSSTPPVNGYTGNTNVVNVLDNDTLDGTAIIPSEVTITITTPPTNPGVKLDPLTGIVSVDPQTPAGTYTIVYQLCEILNPTNCDPATVTVVVDPPVIVATDDSPATPVNGHTGNTNVVNVLDNDTLDGTAVIPSEVTITITTPSTDPGVKLDPLTGIVSVDPQTPAGTYTIVYQICEKLNTGNCESATVTIVVDPPLIVATDDSPATPVNGHTGNTNAVNVLDNDTLDGTAVIPSEVTITITTPPTNPGVKLDPLTGIVSVDPQTPSGTYTIVYQLCEILNPINCDPATVTVVVDSPVIVATDDSPTTPVNGHTGNANIVNVLDNDTLNGTKVIPSEVVITITTPPTDPGVKLDPLTGIVSVDPQTPSGTYTIVYQLCEILNPTNCDPATVTVVVDSPVIVATDDSPTTPVNGHTGNTNIVNVLDNDTLNGTKVIPSEVVITITTPPTDPGVKLDPLTGIVSVDPHTPSGTYTIVYQLCEILNPTNCDPATVTIVVDPPVIVATDDSPATPVNGHTGNTNVVNVLDNDTLNGTTIIPSEVVITITTPPTDPGVKLDPLTGIVSVDPQTPAGTYTIVYQLCEILNPINCDPATVTIVVDPPVIVATDDSPATPVNGHTGNTNVVNVLDNDTLDGTAVIPSEVTITITTPPTNPGVKLDPLTGIVSVDPQTPAGTYTIVYQLCEILNPTNYDPATVTVVVDPPVIVATDDSPATPVNGHTGNTNIVNVLDNDTLDGTAVIPSEVTITITTPSADPGVKLDPLTGIVSVDPQTPSGTYTIVYQLCEILNPTNCDPATVTVVVDPPVIIGTDDSPATPVNGHTGNTNVVNVLDNDTLDGTAVIPSEVTITITTPPTNPGVKLDPLTGIVSVDPQTPSGTYTIVYRLCEILNPTNCDPATVTIVVDPPVIIGTDDSPTTSVNGHTGNTNIVNVLDNDTLNGTTIIPSEVVITITTPPTDPGVKLDPLTGIVSVDPQTPAGTYTIVYQLCEILNPINCDPATVTIVVDPPVIVATDDSPATPVNGHTGNTNVANVLDNDTLNGTKVIPSEVVITITTPPADPGVKLDPLTGIVSVDPQTPAGTYTIVYQICEKLNTGNCESATVTIVIQLPTIEIVKEGIFNDLNGDGFAQVGETITYKFTVANTGTMQLKNVIVTDLLVTITGGPIAVFDPGMTDSTTFTATYQFTQANVDAGFVSNQAVVSSTSISGETITDLSDSSDVSLPGKDDSTVTELPQTPGFKLLKEGIYVDINNDGIANIGDVINYTFTITNTGNVTLSNIVVTDPLVTVSGGPLASLEPLAVDATTYKATYKITKEDIELGAVYNLALADGVDPKGKTISIESKDPTPIILTDPLYEPSCADCTVTPLEQTSKISLVKTASFNDLNNNGNVEEGETITYHFTVTNTGNLDLENIVIADPLPGVVLSGGPIKLSAGESDSTTFSATYAITKADISKKSVSNQAFVSATDVFGKKVADASDSLDLRKDGPTVLALSACNIKIFNAVSPNSDGKNDVFFIQGLECYPENMVEIYNRWGVLVFERGNYNNEERAFRGISEGRTTIKESEGLPTGTYYYIVKYKDEQSNPHQEAGYLYLGK